MYTGSMHEQLTETKWSPWTHIQDPEQHSWCSGIIPESQPGGPSLNPGMGRQFYRPLSLRHAGPNPDRQGLTNNQHVRQEADAGVDC